MTYCINYSVWDVSIYCIYIFGPHSQWWKMEALIVLFFLVLIRFPCTRSTTLCRTSTDVIPGSISSPTTHEHVGHFDTALDIKNKLKRRCWTERWIFLVVFSFLAFNLVKCSVKNPQTDELYCCCPCPPGGAQTTQNEALFWKVQRRDLGFHLEVLAKAKNCISRKRKKKKKEDMRHCEHYRFPWEWQDYCSGVQIYPKKSKSIVEYWAWINAHRPQKKWDA